MNGDIVEQTPFDVAEASKLVLDFHQNGDIKLVLRSAGKEGFPLQVSIGIALPPFTVTPNCANHEIDDICRGAEVSTSSSSDETLLTIKN